LTARYRRAVQDQGIALIAEIVRPGDGGAVGGGGAVPSDALRRLCGELDAAYGPARLADFGATHGTELHGLLRPAADPLIAVLRSSLAEQPLGLRWSFAVGPVDRGPGAADERTGPAVLAARAGLAAARVERSLLRIQTGDRGRDALLADLAPVFGGALLGLSVAQRAVARLLIVDGLRRSDAAERLGVSRATVSVTAERAGVRSIERLARAIRSLAASA
jgi:DNA-binding CsgD family transcriptional regulator